LAEVISGGSQALININPATIRQKRITDAVVFIIMLLIHSYNAIILRWKFIKY